MFAALLTVAIQLPPPSKNVFHQDVAWSPDGKWIAYSELADSEDFKRENWSVWIVGADGAQKRRVLTNAFYVTWSPDGKQVAFGSPRDGNDDIYVAGTDGRTVRRVTNHAAKDSLPAWSPKGGLIAFCSDREDENLDVWLIKPDGAGSRRLTTDPARDYNPAWSPDGKSVVFYREKGDGMDQIWTVDVATGKETQVTNDRSNNVFPAFLPNGEIAYSSQAPDKKESTVLVAPDGTNRRMFELPADSFFARWSPDGKRVAFVSGSWPKSAIYLKDLKTGSITRVVN